MAVQIMTYRDLPEEVRRDSGAQRLARLQERLADRTLTEEQRAALQTEIQWVSAWIQGTIEVSPTPSVINHEVSVGESLVLDEETV